MTQVAILDGIFTDAGPDFRTSIPRNMIPVPKSQGISSGYLRPAEGIRQVSTGPGIDRGAINWNGAHYRVMGSKLVRVSGAVVTELGAIAGVGQVTFDYSFDRLIIIGGGNLYYWNTDGLKQVTDTDLGTAIDGLWVDGFTMTTDGEYIVVADLTDPTAVNPLKYGSAEADPDPVKALKKVRNEPHAVGRYTIEQYNNIGGGGFPFERNEGAQIQRGALGTHCVVVYMEAIAFLGSGRNEAPAVWLGQNGSSTKLSTREIDTLLEGYTEAELSQSVMEVRVFKSHQLLYLHLPDRTLVYDAAASQVVGQPAWHELASSITGPGTYRARNFVWCDDQWLCADPISNALGALDDTISTHYGQKTGWEFGTGIIYNEGRGAIFNMLELVSLPGRIALGQEPVIWTSYSIDGETWSAERPCSIGRQGDRTRRITWLRQGMMRNWRIQKFRGTSDAHLSVARMEMQVEPLNV